MHRPAGFRTLAVSAVGGGCLVVACTGVPVAPAAPEPSAALTAPSAASASPPTTTEPDCPEFTLPAGEPVVGVEACIWRALEGAPDAGALLERACAAESGRGCHNLGMYLLAHPPTTTDAACPSTGVASAHGCRPMTAIDAFHRGCELGEPYACEREASHLFAGIGVSRNPARASLLFEQACNLGLPSSCRYAGPFTAAAENPECKKDTDCALTPSIGCAGWCGECPHHPRTSAVDRTWLRRLEAECHQEHLERERFRQSGRPAPQCSPCPPLSSDPPPLQPAQAICSGGICVAI